MSKLMYYVAMTLTMAAVHGMMGAPEGQELRGAARGLTRLVGGLCQAVNELKKGSGGQ